MADASPVGWRPVVEGAVAVKVDEVGEPAACGLGAPEALLHAGERGADVRFDAEQPDGVEEHSQLERVVAAGGAVPS